MNSIGPYLMDKVLATADSGNTADIAETIQKIFPGWETPPAYPIDLVSFKPNAIDIPIIAEYYGCKAACRNCVSGLFHFGPYCDHHLQVDNDVIYQFVIVSVGFVVNDFGHVIVTVHDRNYKIPRVSSWTRLSGQTC